MYHDDSPFICQLDGMDDDFLDDEDDVDHDDPSLIEERSNLLDQPVDSDSENKENKHDGTLINVINTNARSLCPR